MHPDQRDRLRPVTRMLWLIAATVSLGACDTPVGVAPGWVGTGTLVTNPNGGGPQVIRWGPPDTSHGGRD